MFHPNLLLKTCLIYQMSIFVCSRLAAQICCWSICCVGQCRLDNDKNKMTHFHFDAINISHSAKSIEIVVYKTELASLFLLRQTKCVPAFEFSKRAPVRVVENAGKFWLPPAVPVCIDKTMEWPFSLPQLASCKSSFCTKFVIF